MQPLDDRQNVPQCLTLEDLTLWPASSSAILRNAHYRRIALLAISSLHSQSPIKTLTVRPSLPGYRPYSRPYVDRTRQPLSNTIIHVRIYPCAHQCEILRSTPNESNIKHSSRTRLKPQCTASNILNHSLHYSRQTGS